jgi:hypothetical protein
VEPIALALAAIALLSASMSIATGLSTRRHLRSGSASYDDLVDYTGIFERAALRELSQVSELPDGRFRLNVHDYRKLPRTLPARLFDIPLDAVSALGAMVGTALLAVNSPLGWPLIGLALLHQVLGWAWVIWVTVRHRSEIFGDV